MGSYAYGAQFLKDHDIRYAELKLKDGSAKVMVVPSRQGRVAITSAAGDEGNSYGRINYRFIEAGKQSGQFNPTGGEERFRLDPGGRSYSPYFVNGKEQVYDNWEVPVVIDTETFDVIESNDTVIQLKKSTSVKNASGTVFDLDINREASLLSKTPIEQRLGTISPTDVRFVAYENLNKITDTGREARAKENELISIWMLSHFNPTPITTVFIPFCENARSKVVNDEYLGRIPANRLKTKDGILYPKIDGKLRSKLDTPLMRSRGLCCSYDSKKKVLTILCCNMLGESGAYFNGQWGKQDAPLAGDMLNTYNDGPVEDDSITGPFYEVETSSPGAELVVSESLLHKQETLRIQAGEAILGPIIEKLFGANLETIKSQSQ